MTEDAIENSAVWWQSRRLFYNLALVGSSVVSLALVVAITSQSNDPEQEVTIFTLVTQLFGIAVMVGLANLCYLLNPVCETAVRPENRAGYRRVAFCVGTGFSVAIPLSVPLLLLLVT